MKSLKVALAAACAVAVGWAFTASADIPASAYVQNGLVIQYDGLAALSDGKLSNLGSAGDAFNLLPVDSAKDKVDNGWIRTEKGWSMGTAESAVGGAGYTAEYYGRQTGQGKTLDAYLVIGMSVVGTVGKEAIPIEIGSAGKDSAGMRIGGHCSTWNSNLYKPTGTIASSVAGTRTGTVANDTRVIAYYENGSKISSEVKAGSTAYEIKRVNLGDLRVGAGYYWIGDLGSVRIYNRVLTPSEIRYNAVIDIARFAGADALPPGFRWNATSGKLEVLVSVECRGSNGGTVSVGGSAAGVKSENWATWGEPLTITVSSPAGTSAQAWVGITPVAGEAAGTFTVTVDEPVSAQVVFGSRLCTWTGAAGDGLWATDGNWDTGSVPAAGECVLLDGGAEVTLVGPTPDLAAVVLKGAGTKLTMKEPVRCAPENLVTALKADAVDILDGAVLTHVINSMKLTEFTAAGEWQMDGRVNVECRDFFVDAASKVSGEGMGFYMNGVNRCHGPACGGNTSFADAGAYGAPSCGATVSTLTGGVLTPYGDEYGDPHAPVWAGSSAGGGDNATEKCAGGGAIRIIASGEVRIDGTVTADAQTVSGASRRAGAGGSVWIECLTVAGSGLVTADGTINGGQNDRGGSGGRIAIKYDPAAQRTAGVPTGLRISCNSKSTATRFSSGLPGTVYLPDAQFLGETFSTAGGVSAGRLVLDDWTGWSPTRLTLTNARIWLPSAACADRTLSSLTVDGFAAQLIVGGEENFIIARSALTYVSTCQPNITVTGDLNLLNGGKLVLTPASTNGTDLANGAALNVQGDILLAQNATLTLRGHSVDGSACHVYARNLTVANGATVSSDIQGYSGCTNGIVARAFGPGGVISASGGSHGGFSYAAVVYDDLENPMQAGSGGGHTSGTPLSGSRGGGVVWLTLSGVCENNGTISANAAGQLGNSSGTGAGGSINVTANTFAGTGKFAANGGNGQQDANTGAGGRIALHYDRAAQAALAEQPVFSFDAYTYGGSSTYRVLTSERGTVWLPDATFASGSFAANKLLHCRLYLGDWTGFDFSAIAQKDTFVRLANCPQQLTVGSLTLDNAWLEFGGTAEWRDYAQRRMYETGRGKDIVVAGDVVLTNSSVLSVYGGSTNGNVGAINMDLARTNSWGQARRNRDAVLSGVFTVKGTMTVCENAWVRPYSHPVDGGSYRFDVHKLDIRAGGGFSAEGRGWGTISGSQDRGQGPGGGSSAHGGGYGGRGAKDGGAVYGYAKFPTLPGSGAGRASNPYGGAGGGLVWLNIGRWLHLDGTLNAKGMDGGGTHGSGGSGGGICVVTPEIVCGEGALMNANGGSSNTGASDGSKGGGGRIAVLTETGAEPANLVTTVLYGQSGKDTSKLESGTVYFGKLPGGLRVLVR